MVKVQRVYYHTLQYYRGIGAVEHRSNWIDLNCFCKSKLNGNPSYIVYCVSVWSTGWWWIYGSYEYRIPASLKEMKPIRKKTPKAKPKNFCLSRLPPSIGWWVNLVMSTISFLIFLILICAAGVTNRNAKVRRIITIQNTIDFWWWTVEIFPSLQNKLSVALNAKSMSQSVRVAIA